jgi:hypothetical protein
MATRRSSCPASDCMAGEPRQVDVRIPDLVQAGITEPTRMRAYCHCVYTGEGRAKIIRGYLDNVIAGPGWRPIDANRT